MMLLFLVLNTSLFSLNYEEALLDAAYMAFIQSGKVENAFSVAEKAYKSYHQKKWMIRLVESGIWAKKTDRVLSIARKLEPMDIPINSLPFIKIEDPELYLNIMDYRIKETKYTYYDLKYYLEVSIKLSDNIRIRKFINQFIDKIGKKEKEDIIDYVIKSNNFELIEDNTHTFLFLKEKLCIAVSKHIEKLFNQKRIKMAYNFIEKFNKTCEKNSNFVNVKADFFRNTNNIENYIKTIEHAYKLGFISLSDVENLYNYYLINNNIEKASEVLLYALNKFRLKHLLYYYITTHKEIPQNFLSIFPEYKNLYFSLNLNKITFYERRKFVDYVIRNKSDSEILNYLWALNDYGTIDEKQLISENFNCTTLRNEEILKPLIYINLSINENQKAIRCYLKLENNNIYSDEYIKYLIYENAFHTTISDFEAYKAFNKCNKKNENSYKCLTLSLKFEPYSKFSKKLKVSNLSENEKKEILISYYTSMNMVEKAKYEMKGKNPPWFDFILKDYFNEKYQETSFYLPPHISLYRYYFKNYQYERAMNNLLLELNKNPSNVHTYRELLNIDNELNPNGITLSYLYNKALSKMSAFFNYRILSRYSQNIFISGNICHYSFRDKNIYYQKEQTVKSMFLTFSNKKFVSTFSLYSGIIDTISASLKYLYKQSRNRIEIESSYRKISNDTQESELLLFKNSLVLNFSHRLFSENYLNLIGEISKYMDLKDRHISDMLSFESNISAKYRNLIINPYIKHTSYTSQKIPSFYREVFILPIRILPNDFSEYGIKFSYNFRGTKIEIVPFYNSQSHKGIFTSISKTFLTKRSRVFIISLMYNSNSVYRDSSITSAQISSKF